jgi:queuine/archaeosine tRNA-ribosyltransferase
MRDIRNAIESGRYDDFVKEFYAKTGRNSHEKQDD